ncbi:hypothetical protein P3342_012137 [Pyrenophora teres f. teres]|nr:hypothetical protein P3342_012137 [Pyrenophora teres f. teres]
MSDSQSSGKGSSKKTRRQATPDPSERQSDAAEFLSFGPGIPPPTTPQKDKRAATNMPDDDIQMAGVPPIVYPPESSASQQVPTPSESYQPSTAQERHESDMAKVLQIMAGMASRSATPVYASQLPPYPADSVPTFDGNNVTLFIERYEEMARYYKFTPEMMLERLSAHCSHKQKEIIQSMEEFEEAQRTGSWKDLRKALKKRFRTNDRYQQEVRTEYFEHWLKECQARTELSTMEYLQEFHIRSRRCVEAATIEESRRILSCKRTSTQTGNEGPGKVPASYGRALIF